MKKTTVIKGINCPHCGAANPAHAYCCLHCYKVLRDQRKVPFWKIHIRLDLAALLIVLVFAGGLAMMLKTWLATIEAEVTFNLSTADTVVTLSADKRKKASLKFEGNKSTKDQADQASRGVSDK